MEENGDVKAPVTRLRRRLSVEQMDDIKSPSTPSTPTKKRAGRLAAKPQLELIDENAPQITPKKVARRSLARDVLEPVEEKPVTPARRSARVKSNTSLVLELEAVQNLDTPRAKRAAARRNSQIGSDNEAPITPARTRRTRKDSTSSVEILAIETPVTPGRTRKTRKDSASSDMQGENAPASITTPLITEVISEEPEIEHKNLTISATFDESKDQNSSSSPRKSPRIKANVDNENIDNITPDNKSETIISSKSESNKAIKTEESGNTAKLEDNSIQKNKSIIDLHKDKLSTCSVSLIKLKSVDINPKIKLVRMNKSASAVDHSNISDSKRHRTKSWNTLTVPLSDDNMFFSDNESTQNIIRKNEVRLDMSCFNQTGSINSEPTREYIDELEKVTAGKEKSSSSKKKKKRNENSFNTDGNRTAMDSSNANKSSNFDVSVIETAVGNVSNESNKENVDEINSISRQSNVASILFQNPVNTFIKSTLFIEDSDTDSRGKANKQLEGEDQCVPVVDHQMKTMNLENQVFDNFNASEQKVTDNCSCEPMDIDETIPDNIIINDSSTENLENEPIDEKGSRKSSLCIPQTALENIVNEGSNKSRRKSFISNSIIQDVDRTGNESKSTLVLSQIKDMSSAGHNESKSFNELLSKSVNLPNVAKGEIIKHNVSLNYLTSTPVQQKDFKKLGMQMNTSVIAPCNEGKKEVFDTKHSIEELSKTSNNSDSSEEELESSKKQNIFVEDEAVDAGDDYESGDSQDEEEKQYEEDHEIFAKGETLTSEDEISNDSDYEKDSFLVSSDEEDDDLLSGTGDDLDMSDNELTMSAKSKKKFNKRSIKKQKSASKEMFEARHKLNASDRSSKEKQSKINNKRRRLDSSLLESEDDNYLPPKKNKRMRLDSTWESMTKSENEEDVVPKDKNTNEAVSDTSDIALKKKKKVNRLSDSICDSDVNKKEVNGDSVMKDETKPKKKKKDKRLSDSEHNESLLYENEITVCDRTIGNDDPLLTAIKKEPKTPNKDLEISTIQFTTREDIEQVNIDHNTSIMKSNMSLDPLMATFAQGSGDESSLNEEGSDSNNEEASLLSENEEITNNYDSILNELNKEMKSKHIKTFDTSLDLNKKTKKKAKEPIIAELNITETKNKSGKFKSKKINSESEVTGNKLKSVVKKIANNSDDDSASDSIHLRLLFSEDSNDSSKSKEDTEVEHFIPLKRTEGKTNISERASINASEIEDKETSMNVSSKKKNKKLNLSKQDISTANTSKVVDDTLLNTSANKKNMRQLMQNEENIISNDIENLNQDTSLNISSKKKNKKRKSSLNEDRATLSTCEVVNEPLLNTSSKIKNKVVQTQDKDGPGASTCEVVNEPLLNTSSKIKNKVVQTQDKDGPGANDSENVNHDTSLNSSSKKKNKKRKSSLNEDTVTPSVSEVANESLLKTNSKNKNKIVQSTQDEDDVAANDSENVNHDTSLNSSSKKKKKKRKSSLNESSAIPSVSEVANESLLKTNSKNKNKIVQSTQDEDDVAANATEIGEDDSKTLITSSKSKKKRKSRNEDDVNPDATEIDGSEPLNASSDKKNKKRNLSQNKGDAPENEPTGDVLHFFVDTTGTRAEYATTTYDSFNTSPKPKEKLIYFDNDDEHGEPKKTIVNKKRKVRDDDDSVTTSKVLKQSSFDEIIPRLPATIINNLESKRRKVFEAKKTKVVSTTEFSVEDNRRKNKPSNFLEQTVYMNTNTESPDLKKKLHIKKPKVLPFIPTASTSHSGFTTNFKINIIPQKVDFVAQSSDVTNFKNDYLINKKIKKLGTYELYRQQRNVKLSKF